MSISPVCTRREFVTRLAAGSAGVAAAGWPARAAQPPDQAPYTIIGFTKPFQQLSFEETADVVAEAGWAGIECPVRKGGQVAPERVEEDLPKLVEALKKRNKEVTIVTTDIRSRKDAMAENVLRTAAKLGIRYYRLSYWKYDTTKPILPQVEAIRAELRGLADLNRQIGICGGIQNHSGSDYFGAPLWDACSVAKDLDPKALGIFFDIGHATVEGGYTWPIQAKLAEPYLASVYVKDFRWEKKRGQWQAEWCPLGEGMVNRSFFKSLRSSGFKGPISQHQEYPLGSRAEMIRFIRRDLEVLKSWLG